MGRPKKVIDGVETEEVETEEVVVTTTATDIPITVSVLPVTVRIVENIKFSFVKCPDGCEYELADVPKQFQHLI